MFAKRKKEESVLYDEKNWKPVLKCSICNGERVAGFLNVKNGEFREENFIRDEADLQIFKKKYNIKAEIEKIY